MPWLRPFLSYSVSFKVNKNISINQSGNEIVARQTDGQTECSDYHSPSDMKMSGEQHTASLKFRLGE
jgi:hypothetical protein